MDQDTSSALSIAEIIAARLFHDFASPISGIINSVEFLKSENVQTETLSFLQNSSDELLYRFKIMQQAYSFSESNLSFQETKDNIKNYLSQKKIEIEWNTEILCIEDTSLIEKINKIISNTIVLIASRIISRGTISLAIEKVNDKTLVNVAITDKDTNASLKTTLASGNSDQLDTKNINAYFLLLLLKSYNATVNYHNNDSINIVFLKVHPKSGKKYANTKVLDFVRNLFSKR